MKRGLGSGVEVIGTISHCTSAPAVWASTWGLWYLPPGGGVGQSQLVPEHPCLLWQLGEVPGPSTALSRAGLGSASLSSPLTHHPSGSKYGLGCSLTPEKQVDADSLLFE